MSTRWVREEASVQKNFLTVWAFSLTFYLYEVWVVSLTGKTSANFQRKIALLQFYQSKLSLKYLNHHQSQIQTSKNEYFHWLILLLFPSGETGPNTDVTPNPKAGRKLPQQNPIKHNYYVTILIFYLERMQIYLLTSKRNHMATERTKFMAGTLEVGGQDFLYSISNLIPLNRHLMSA